MSVESRMGIKRHKFFTSLAEVVERTLKEHERSDAEAILVANAVVDRLVKHWSGQTIGIPKDFRWELSARELEIFDAFTGSNWEELARRHDITDRSVRRLVNRVLLKLAAVRHKQQMDLLNPCDGA